LVAYVIRVGVDVDVAVGVGVAVAVGWVLQSDGAPRRRRRMGLVSASLKTFDWLQT